MKSIISGSLDFIIEDGGNPIYDESRALIPGANLGTFKQKRYIKSVSMFVQIGDPYSNGAPQFVRLYLTADDIKKLHSEIVNTEGKEFEAPYDDLPW